MNIFIDIYYTYINLIIIVYQNKQIQIINVSGNEKVYNINHLKNTLIEFGSNSRNHLKNTLIDLRCVFNNKIGLDEIEKLKHLKYYIVID